MLWLILILPTFVFGNDYLWSVNELELLEGSYKHYIQEVRKNPSVTDLYLAEPKPLVNTFPILGLQKNTRSVPDLQLLK